MPVWKYSSSAGPIEATAFADIPLDLDVADGPHLDLFLDLDVQALSFADIPLDLEVLASGLFDLALDLAVGDGTLFSDLPLDLAVTDGVHFRDIRLDLGVIDPVPAFRSVLAQRLGSVLTEV